MTRQIATLGLTLALAVGPVSCTEKDEQQPAAQGQNQLPAGHPSVGGTELPEPPSGNIEGELTLADDVKDEVAAGDTIYVMARNAATGSLIAVVKVTAPAEFPAPFALTGELKHGETSLAGKVKIEARVDKDGDPMTKSAGDVVGEAEGLVSVPAEGVKVELDQVLQEQEQKPAAPAAE